MGGIAMNNRYKFRGKRIDNGEWVYGNLIYSSDACKEYETLIIPQKNADGFTTDYASNGENKESYGFDNWFCVVPETVGQYTGLKDKNGKEIYEGDIVTYENFSHAVYGAIAFGKIEVTAGGHQGFYIEWQNNGENKWREWWRQDIYNWNKDVEVIGNIHENKELLQN